MCRGDGTDGGKIKSVECRVGFHFDSVEWWNVAYVFVKSRPRMFIDGRNNAVGLLAKSELAFVVGSWERSSSFHRVHSLQKEVMIADG